MTSTPPSRGRGITAGPAARLARDLAARCQQLGYHSLRANDEAASGLQTLGHFAAAAPRLELGVGTLPLDRHQPSRIATEIDPPRDRSPRGFGSDRIRPASLANRPATARRRRTPLAPPTGNSHRRRGHATPAVPSRRRGGRRRPPQLDAARSPRRGAPLGAGRSRRGGRAAPIVASYVRVAVGSGSLQRLRDEERHYRNINDNHRKHFAAMNVPLGSVGVTAPTPPQVRRDGAVPVGARPPDLRVLENGRSGSFGGEVHRGSSMTTPAQQR